MSTSRPFTYNTGSAIPGTDQVGDLAIGYPTSGFESTGLQWWAGPDEDLGYVIGKPVAGNNQPTPLFSGAPSGQLTLSPTYIGNSMNLSNGNQTVEQKFGYVQSVLGQTLINGNDKVMFSVLCSLAAPATFPNGHFVGIGTTSMNYNGVTPDPYNSYPGNDNQSIGLNSGGEYWYNGTIQASGLPTWTTGDIIDITVDLLNGSIWIRVNGGNWNNNPSDNPATGTGGQGILGGLTSFYPVLCPSYEGTMTILNNATYGVPSGFTLLGTNINASVGFSRSSALTDPSFISIANAIAGPSGPFASAANAKTWLNANGYWTSYEGGTGATGGTGDFNVTITQVGPDVVWSGSGSFNLTDLTSLVTVTITSGFQSNNAIWIAGSSSTPPGATGQQYGGASLTYPTTFSSGGSPTILGIGATGSMFGVLTGGASGRTIVVPNGYTSGTTISGSTTYSNTTISGLGLSGGTYTWAWGSGANASTLVMVIS